MMLFRRFKFEIFFTIPLCAVAVALTCAALVTEEWAKGGLAYTLSTRGGSRVRVKKPRVFQRPISYFLKAKPTIS